MYKIQHMWIRYMKEEITIELSTQGSTAKWAIYLLKIKDFIYKSLSYVRLKLPLRMQGHWELTFPVGASAYHITPAELLLLIIHPQVLPY